jgi:hypothetical protein
MTYIEDKKGRKFSNRAIGSIREQDNIKINAIKITLNMSGACCNDGDMQTTRDHALLLVLVIIRSLPSPDLLNKYEWEVLSHAPYSTDMSPPDFDLFHKLK